MSINAYRYSAWDGSQEVPDVTADDLLEKMADDLLRGGDPERALRNLLRSGFELPDGRRFEGLQKLLQQMREYRQDALSRYDPNGLIDSIKEELEKILGLEREEIERRRPNQTPATGADHDAENGPAGAPKNFEAAGREGGALGASDSDARPRAPEKASSDAQEPGTASGQVGSAGAGSPSDGNGDDGSSEKSEFEQMLERMLQRKEDYLEQLPENN